MCLADQDPRSRLDSGQVALAGVAVEQGGAAASVEEQVLALCHILEVNLRATVDACKDAGSCQLVAQRGRMSWALAGGGSPGNHWNHWSHSPCRGQQLQAVPQADAHTVVCNFAERAVGNLHAFRRGSEPYNPLDLLGVVWRRGDNEQPRQEIRRDPVRRGKVFGTANRRHAAI